MGSNATQANRSLTKNIWVYITMAVATLLLIVSSAAITPQHAYGAEVETISNPANTTIDVFDYWIYDNKGNSSKVYADTGINKGHQLVFRASGGSPYGDWNAWTGSGKGAYQGIVASTLGSDGYPVLAVGNQKSLGYLFDGSNINDGNKPAKRAYMGANYLFTVDDESGNYYFNAETEKAKLNTATNEFTVTSQSNGEFYPFSDKDPDKFFFGVHVNSEFSIPENGKVKNKNGEYKDMVYTFVGDDDVWVYIDGILVGDVGGIHDAQDLSINFATGEVVVKNHANGGSVHKTTIKAMVVEALGEEAAEQKFDWDGNTIASGYHTMDFFYLERGAGKSNMKISYNLVSTYDFTAHKALYRGGSEGDQPLKANQFKYKLTGWADDDGYEAVMPKHQPDKNVYWSTDYGHAADAELPTNSANDPKTIVVGVSADGNVNFGNAELNGTPEDPASELAKYNGRTFKYVIEELPPDGAVYDETTETYTYKGETIEKNDDGTYTFDGVTYDNKKYYFKGTIAPEGWVNKTYYTDDTYTTKAAVNFADFTNLYNSTGKVQFEAKKVYKDAYGETLDLENGAFTFKLTDVTNSAKPEVIQADVLNDEAGAVSFEQIVYSLEKDLPNGLKTKTYTYKIEENIPDGATLNDDGTYTSGNITYSGESYYAQVTLTDNGDGTLGIEKKYYSDEKCTKEIDAADLTFVNTLNATTVQATKVWDDGDDATGRSDVTLHLWQTVNEQESEVEGQTKTIAANATGEELTVTWENLPILDANGNTITYSVKEDAVSGYTTSVTSSTEEGTGVTCFTVTNIKTVDVQVVKEWKDNNNQDGIQPASVEAVLSAAIGENSIDLPEGVDAKQPLNADNSWTYTWVGLPKYQSGSEIVYSIDETKTTVITGDDTSSTYAYTVSGNVESGFTITNTHTPATTDVTAKKIWVGDGAPTATPTFTLSKTVDGTTTELSDEPVWTGNSDGSSTATWSNLPKYEGGSEIAYSVAETGVSGAVAEGANTYYVYDTTKSVEGSDPPEYYVKGKWTSTSEVVDGTTTITNTWTPATEESEGTTGFTIAKVDENGTAIKLPAVFKLEKWNGEAWVSVKKLTTSTEDGTVNVGGLEDGRYQLAETEAPTGYEGSGKWIVTVKGSQGDTLIRVEKEKLNNVFERVFEFMSESASEACTWDGTNLKLTVKNQPTLTSVDVKKVWDDKSNQDGVRPESVTFRLYKIVGNSETAVKDVTLTGEGDTWTTTIDKLPEYENGTIIYYFIKELTSSGEVLLEDGSLDNNYVVAYSDEDKTATNTHVPEETKIEVTKVWKDKDNQDGIRPASVEVTLLANGKPVEKEGVTAKQTLNEGNSWHYKWTGLDKKAGGKDIVYTVEETKTAVISGEDKEGTYACAITGDAGSGFTVTNTHTPATTKVTVAKQWAGDDAWKDTVRPESVTVNLLANGEAAVDADGKAVPAATVTGTNWTYTFENLPKYDNGKVITYTATEEAVAGYTTTYSEDKLTITNTYSPTPTTAKIQAQKNLVGRDWFESDSFEFVLSAVNGAPMPGEESTAKVNATNDSVIDFGDITYSKPGVYEYTVSETKGEVGGIKYDTTVYNVSVTVTGDKQGKLSAAVSYGEGNELAKFTNTYSANPVAVDPPVQKTLVIPQGLTGPGSIEGKFSFTIENTVKPDAVEKAPMPENTKITNSKQYEKTNKPGFYEFGEIVFTAPGTYTYKVTESGTVAGVTNDREATSGKTLTFTVTDDGKGNLVVDPADDSVWWAFTNTYGVEPLVEKGFNAHKTVEFFDLAKLYDKEAQAGQFTFELVDADGKVVSSGTNDKDGNVSFSSITYKEPGTHTYTLREQEGKASYIDYDDATYKVTVTVSDNGDGSLKAEIACADADGNPVEKPSFKNVYKASNKIQLSAEKSVETDVQGHNLKDGQFTFTLSGSEGAPMPEKATATNNAGGSVTFDEITFDVSKIDEKYWTYEDGQSDGEEGQSDDQSDEAISAASDDESAGDAADSATSDGAAADGSDSAAGAADATADDSTGSSTAGSSAAGSSANGSSSDGSSAAGSNAAESPSTGSSAAGSSASGSGTAESPSSGGSSTATEDDSLATAGSASASTVRGMPIFRFTGTAFADDDDATDAMSASQVNDVAAGAADGAQSGATAEDELSTQSDESESPDSSTSDGAESEGKRHAEFTYTITEVNDGQAGYTYDTHAEKVKVTVKDDGKGKLTVAAEYDADDATFVNTYTATPASANLSAKKVLDGATLKDGRFSFALTGADGAPMPKETTVKNAEDGTVAFGPISFTQPGTYTYSVSEVNDKQDNITYDTSVHTVTVTVVDNGEGALTAAVAYDSGNVPVFKNKYSEPNKPSKPDKSKKSSAGSAKKSTAKTGDPIGTLVVGLAFAGAAGAFGATYARRRSNK